MLLADNKYNVGDKHPFISRRQHDSTFNKKRRAAQEISWMFFVYNYLALLEFLYYLSDYHLSFSAISHNFFLNIFLISRNRRGAVIDRKYSELKKNEIELFIFSIFCSVVLSQTSIEQAFLDNEIVPDVLDKAPTRMKSKYEIKYIIIYIYIFA